MSSSVVLEYPEVPWLDWWERVRIFATNPTLLIDKSVPKITDSLKNMPGESMPNLSKRIYAINSAGKNILERVGSWEVICDDYRYWPAYKMQTLDSLSSSGFTTFTASQYTQVRGYPVSDNAWMHPFRWRQLLFFDDLRFPWSDKQNHCLSDWPFCEFLEWALITTWITRKRCHWKR